MLEWLFKSRYEFGLSRNPRWKGLQRKIKKMTSSGAQLITIPLVTAHDDQSPVNEYYLNMQRFVHEKCVYEVWYGLAKYSKMTTLLLGNTKNQARMSRSWQVLPFWKPKELAFYWLYLRRLGGTCVA